MFSSPGRLTALRALRSLVSPRTHARTIITGATAEAYKQLAALGGEGSVTLNIVSSGVAIVKLSQPKHLNALTPAMMCNLSDVVTQLEQYEGRAVILCGDGGAFCSGIDLKQTAVLSPAMGHNINLLMADTTQRLFHSRLVTVALVQRFAIGAGAELSTAADFRLLVGPEAYIQFVHVARGLVPAIGGAARLAKLIGREKALMALLSAKKYAGADAVAVGLATAVLPGVEKSGVEEALTWLAPLLHVEAAVEAAAAAAVPGAKVAPLPARRPAPVPPEEVRAIKRALDAADSSKSVEEGIRMEGAVFDSLWGGKVQLEAMAGERALSSASAGGASATRVSATVSAGGGKA